MISRVDRTELLVIMTGCLECGAVPHTSTFTLVIQYYPRFAPARGHLTDQTGAFLINPIPFGTKAGRDALRTSLDPTKACSSR